jgi:cbb3-type cytochrome oxidase maturation protein
MSAIIFLIFLGILVAGGFLAAFIWAVKSGQYDDDYSPSVRILFDNNTPREDEGQIENINHTKKAGENDEKQQQDNNDQTKMNHPPKKDN